MGQDEIFNIIEKKPRLSTREIADLIKKDVCYTSRLIGKLLYHQDIIANLPTEEEIDKLLKTYPSLIHGIWRVKLFEVNDKK